MLIEFPGKTDPDVVYVEGIMGDLYLESVEQVKRYQAAFERNQAVAMSPKESSALLSAPLVSGGASPATAEVTTTASRPGRPVRGSPSTG